MSDDEVDLELLNLLRQRLGISTPQDGVPRDTGILKNAEFIYSNAIDVHVDMYGTKSAAMQIYKAMQDRAYSTQTWTTHELHPKPSEGFSELDMVNFIFTMDLLNFSFWSELSPQDRFQVEYRGKRWTGYNSLVACLRRALDEGIPFTTPRFWTAPRCTRDVFAHVFRSATAEPIPLLQERIDVLREASTVLRESFADDDDDFDDDDDDDDDDDVNGGDDFLEASKNTIVVTGSSATAGPAPPTECSDQSIDTDLDNPRDPDDDRRAEQDSSLNPTVNGHSGMERSSHPSSQLTEAPALNNLPEIDSAPLGAIDHMDNDALSTVPVDTSASAPPATDVSVENKEADAVASESSTLALNLSPADLRPDHAVLHLIQEADQSAGKLVNLLAKHFNCFRDETRFDGRKVRILKRAQIFVADLWAALNDTGPGHFEDIDHLTMFADYRVPQSLHSLGVLTFSPPLDYHIRDLKRLEPGHSWEVQLRGCSIWAVELIRREILRAHPDATTSINAVLIDFFLYDLAKEREAQGQPAIPHHRTRSIWY